MRHFPKEKNFRKLRKKVFSKKNVLRFLSLRYSADFRRSRIVFFFSRRFSREKFPTLTVASFFFSFFFVRLQSHSDWATFLTIETTKTTTIRPSPVSGN